MNFAICLLSVLVAVAAVIQQGFAQDSAAIDVQQSIDRIKQCYDRDSTQFNKCLFDFWTEVGPMLVAGIPQLNIPALDPYKIDKIEANNKGNVVEGKAAFYNITTRGLSKYIPKSVVADIRSQTVTVEITIPVLDIEGTYDIDGRALLVDVKGKGPFVLKMTDVEGKAVAHIERDGPNGVKLGKTEIDFKVGNLSGRLDNLFGEGDVSESINRLLNENAQDILQDVKPLATARIATEITKVLGGSIKELPKEAFILPEGFVPPEGVTLPPGITAPPAKP